MGGLRGVKLSFCLQVRGLEDNYALRERNKPISPRAPFNIMKNKHFLLI